MNNHELESFRRDVRYAAYPAKVGLGLLKVALLLVLGILAFTCIVGLLGCLAWLSRTFGGS